MVHIQPDASSEVPLPELSQSTLSYDHIITTASSPESSHVYCVADSVPATIDGMHVSSGYDGTTSALANTPAQLISAYAYDTSALATSAEYIILNSITTLLLLLLERRKEAKDALTD